MIERKSSKVDTKEEQQINETVLGSGAQENDAKMYELVGLKRGMRQITEFFQTEVSRKQHQIDQKADPCF